MESLVNDRLSEVRDLKDIMRSLARMQEVKSGTFRVAAGTTRGQLNFQDGFVVGASASSDGDLHGRAAFEALMALPEIVSEFVAEQAPLADRRDELCIDVTQLIQNHFSLDGIPWAPRVGTVRTKTGQLPGFIGKRPVKQEDDVDTVSIIATHAAEMIAMANEKERDEQEATGPMPAQGESEPAYDLSALDAIPTPGSGKTAPKAEAAASAPAPAPTPAPAPAAAPAYDLSALDSIPTPGSGGKAPTPQPAQAPAPAPALTPAPAYDLSALEAIPTPGSGKTATPQTAPTPAPTPAAAQAPAPAYDLSALEAIPTPGSGKAATPQPELAMQAPQPAPTPTPAPAPQAAPAYDLSALESIPTPGSGGKAPTPAQPAGFMKKMAQSTESVKRAAPQMPPQPAPHVVAETPAPSAPATSGKPYDLSALESIPTPGAKPSTPAPAPAPMQAAAPAPTPAAAPAAPVSSAEAMTAQWSSGESVPAGGFPMQRIASILLVITLALAAFVVPGMIKQSMKPANVEPDMNKQQMKGFVTDQMKEQTPYAH